MEVRKAMTTHLVETEGLTRRFGRLIAVDGLNLRVPQGSIYGFLGPNGAGKTTTIRMLLGLIRPTAGRVHLFGMPMHRNATEVLAQIGSLVETPAVYLHLTGRENLEVIRRLRGGTRAQVSHALWVVGLEEAADRRAGTYSLGMIQRLGLAIALMATPPLLILDEPTNGLDPAGIHEVRELIRRLPGEYGVTVLVSSHLLGEVEQIATQIGIIQAGRLIFQGTPDGLRGRYQDHVALKVDQPEAAQQTLRVSGWQVEHNNNHTLRVVANGESDAALLISQLVAAGCSIYGASLEQPSLEEIFLQLTATPAAGGIR
jgi:ABC-type multidrug transport system ATPase subunit